MVRGVPNRESGHATEEMTPAAAVRIGSGARVGCRVGVEQSFLTDVCVDLRRVQAPMPEQFLDAAQIRASIEEVRRERMA